MLADDRASSFDFVEQAVPHPITDPARQAVAHQLLILRHWLESFLAQAIALRTQARLGIGKVGVWIRGITAGDMATPMIVRNLVGGSRWVARRFDVDAIDIRRFRTRVIVDDGHRISQAG